MNDDTYVEFPLGGPVVSNHPGADGPESVVALHSITPPDRSVWTPDQIDLVPQEDESGNST